MKKIIIYICIFLLLIVLAYTCNISNIPSSVILLEGETLSLNTLFGVKTVQASSNTAESNNNKVNIELSFLGGFTLKQIDVNVLPETKVVPVGKVIGLKLYTNGVLIVGMTEIDGEKPYEYTGLKEGDTILEINNTEIDSIEKLKEVVNKSNGEELELKYLRDGTISVSNIKPVQTNTDEYKLGLWVRDAATGVGTITYYEPESGKFAALGHGIVDVDTDKLIDIESGEVVTSSIVAIKKGEQGIPGEIKGTIMNQTNIGEVTKNTDFGIYGNLTNTASLNINSQKAIDVALRSEIKTGNAKVLCTLENGVTKKYDIEIKKIYANNNSDNKSMLIKVTDEDLLNQTGGIIRGLSGAPIIQNGKFCGAVTHVLVSDPTMGYAVFGDLMIKEMN